MIKGLRHKEITVLKYFIQIIKTATLAELTLAEFN